MRLHFPDCPVRGKETEVARVRDVQCVSYLEAVRRVEGASGVEFHTLHLSHLADALIQSDLQIGDAMVIEPCASECFSATKESGYIAREKKLVFVAFSASS
jgi:hypothetical protein